VPRRTLSRLPIVLRTTKCIRHYKSWSPRAVRQFSKIPRRLQTTSRGFLKITQHIEIT
jgi:hypothetical protein